MKKFMYPVAALVTLSCPVSWSETPLLGQTRFMPTEAEFAEFKAASLQVPDDAVLDYAYFTTTQQMIGQELRTIRWNTYRLSWPIDVAESGVRFHQSASCTRSEIKATECFETEELAAWRGALVSFEQVMSRFEVVEVLREADRLIPRELVMLSVEKLSDTAPRQRFAGVRRYIVSTQQADGPVSYIVERNCTRAAECVWSLSR